jgi:hypothetical protein
LRAKPKKKSGQDKEAAEAEQAKSLAFMRPAIRNRKSENLAAGACNNPLTARR